MANGYSGLLVIDIRKPANPQHVGSYDTSNLAYGVAVSGNYAYVADGDAGLGSCFKGAGCEMARGGTNGRCRGASASQSALSPFLHHSPINFRKFRYFPRQNVL